MRTTRDALPIVAAAVVALCLEALAMRLGTTAKVLVAGFLAVVAVLVLAKVDLYRFAVGSALLAAFTLPWNGVVKAGVRPGDALVLVAVMAFVAAGARGEIPELPWWVKQLAIGVIAVAVLHELIPTSAEYLRTRLVVNAGGQPVTPNYSGLVSNLGTAFKFLVGIIAIPLAFSFPALRNPRTVNWFAASFAAGNGLSGLVAFVDRFTGLGIAGKIIGYGAAGGRQAGFSAHPNFLAAGCALAIPIALWLCTSKDRTRRLLGIACLVGNAVGIYASGSRGGTVALVFAIAVATVVMPRMRRWAVPLSIGGVAALVSVIAVFPAIGQKILRTTRLGGGDATAEGSNYVRDLLANQGLHDFQHRPIDGIGLQVGTEASNVYLQELAAGGLILFIALSLYMIGAAYTAFRYMPRYSLAAALLVCMITAAALNYVEANLTDRYYYVPGALIVALVTADRVLTRRRAADEDASDVPAELALRI